ncbi:MAG: nicotinamide-nucleotide amidohydrolase family protein [Bacteroidia bacterium]|nr:nicotinamide-nucleotide amidohydrolase family protein [Bacteroidia bacterium]MDW8015631.1 nicotinamide-nucleotide amidohydrolase family protein [Bacteroidia bacterium]
MPPPEASILLIGSELTEGRLADRNGRFLAEELSEMGFRVREIRIFPDDDLSLRAGMREMLQSGVRVLLSAGGLGHTTDDLTAQVWAEVLGDKLEVSSSLLAELEGQLQARGIPSLPYLDRYALVPTRGEALPNPIGLAPALYWEVGLQVICALPGPPAEVQAIWHTSLKPRLQKRFSLTSPLHHTFRTTGITESRLSVLIQEWEAQLPPFVRLSYGPSLEGVALHLRAPGDVPIETFLKEVETLRQLIAPYLYAEGNISLAEAILNELRRKGLTLAIAESCTGGHIAAQIVNIAGASDVFLGSVVSYANSAKEALLGVSPTVLQAEGAVSEVVARQMAEGVCRTFGASVGIATTGIAGPTGGSPEKPVGTVWFGIATPKGTIAKRYILPGDRQTVIQRATALALSLTWQVLRAEK